MTAGAQLVEKLVNSSEDGSNGTASSSVNTAYSSAAGGGATRASAATESKGASSSNASVLFALSNSTENDAVHSPLGAAAGRISDSSGLSENKSQNTAPSGGSLLEEPRYSDWLLMSDEQLMAAIDASEGEDYEYRDAV